MEQQTNPNRNKAKKRRLPFLGQRTRRNELTVKKTSPPKRDNRENVELKITKTKLKLEYFSISLVCFGSIIFISKPLYFLYGVVSNLWIPTPFFSSFFFNTERRKSLYRGEIGLI